MTNIARTAEIVFVVTNNHFEGKAIVNALQLISMLRGSPVPVPESLREHYPQLLEVALREAMPPPLKQSDFAFGALDR